MTKGGDERITEEDVLERYGNTYEDVRVYEVRPTKEVSVCFLQFPIGDKISAIRLAHLLAFQD